MYTCTIPNASPQSMLPDGDRSQVLSPTEECQFVVKPLFTVKCPVVGTMMLEPHQTDCCGWHLSAEGVTKLQKAGEACWQCKRLSFMSRPDMYLRQKIHELQVYCPHRKRGCEWVGKLSMMDTHVDSCPRIRSPLETDLAQLSQ